MRAHCREIAPGDHGSDLLKQTQWHSALRASLSFVHVLLNWIVSKSTLVPPPPTKKPPKTRNLIHARQLYTSLGSVHCFCRFETIKGVTMLDRF